MAQLQKEHSENVPVAPCYNSEAEGKRKSLKVNIVSLREYLI
jgi:hypothetical protein